MIASGDLPDIIEYRWTDFPGGPSAALNNNIIIKLNDTINKWSPNLKSYLASKPVYDKEAKMDDGSYYFYPFLRDGKELLHTSGPIIRKDWLDADGLKVPETMDDWYTMLKAFKDKNGATSPLTSIGTKDAIQAFTLFQTGFNAIQDFYVDSKGKIQYGYLEKEYKDTLTYLNKLYTEGLLDKNFNSADKKAQSSNMLNGKSGATYGAGGGDLGVYLDTMSAKDPKYNVVGAKFPVQKAGDKLTKGAYTSGMDRNTQVAITTKCKDVESAARLLDYGYSKEGKLFYNFGTEGVSYTMVNGTPKYTDTVMKNPDKLTVAQAIAKYARGNMSGPFPQDPGYIEQYYEKQQQKDALKLWSDRDMTVMPLLTPTDEESSETAKILNDVGTYNMEMSVKFIMGTEPLSNFDNYVANLKKMNIDRAITLKQQAYDRFNKR
jgi:ABC-type sugar transport system, periplasmic component